MTNQRAGKEKLAPELPTSVATANMKPITFASAEEGNNEAHVVMEIWIREFNAIFAQVRPNRQTGTMVMRRMALAARRKPPSNMAAPEIEPGSRG